MRVVLIRHPAPAIAAGICYGRLDVGLEPGAQYELAQRATNPLLQGAKRIWTSPARRCQALAAPIARYLAVECFSDERLLELNFGEWEGRAWNDVPRASLDEWAASVTDFAPPGGETGIQLIQRVSDFFSDLCEDDRDCAVVSHGGPLKILSALMTGRPVDLLEPAPPIGSATVIDIQS